MKKQQHTDWQGSGSVEAPYAKRFAKAFSVKNWALIQDAISNSDMSDDDRIRILDQF